MNYHCNLSVHRRNRLRSNEIDGQIVNKIIKIR